MENNDKHKTDAVKTNGEAKKSKNKGSHIAEAVEETNGTVTVSATASNEHATKGSWNKHETVLLRDYGTTPSKKIYSFDVDDTIITPKSGKKFAVDKNDWKFWDASVVKTLKKHHENGFKIVFMSNQSGISKGKVSAADWQFKLDKVQEQLGIPIQVFGATDGDYFRKPCIGMWDLLTTNYNGGVKVEEAMYIGDAAGRPKTSTRAKDHSDSDHKFAVNVGIDFQTPEVFFKGEKVEKLPAFDFDPRNYKTCTNPVKSGDVSKLTSTEVEMVIFVGSPGSGKSTFFNTYFKPKGYGHVNQDTLKTEKACVKAAEGFLSKNQSCVIDNTNPEKSKRQVFISAAKNLNIPVRCVFFDFPKDLIFHLNNLRDINPHRNHYSKSVADVVIHTWYKKLEKPETKEGIKEVITLEFVPGPFTSQDDEKIFYCLS